MLHYNVLYCTEYTALYKLYCTTYTVLYCIYCIVPNILYCIVYTVFIRPERFGAGFYAKGPEIFLECIRGDRSLIQEFYFRGARIKI